MTWMHSKSCTYRITNRHYDFYILIILIKRIATPGRRWRTSVGSGGGGRLGQFHCGIIPSGLGTGFANTKMMIVANARQIRECISFTIQNASRSTKSLFIELLFNSDFSTDHKQSTTQSCNKYNPFILFFEYIGVTEWRILMEKGTAEQWAIHKNVLYQACNKI